MDCIYRFGCSTLWKNKKKRGKALWRTTLFSQETATASADNGLIILCSHSYSTAGNESDMRVKQCQTIIYISS